MMYFTAFTILMVAKTAFHNETYQSMYQALLKRYARLAEWVIENFNAVCQKIGFVEVDYTIDIQLKCYIIQKWISGCKHEWQLATCEKAIEDFIINKYPFAQCEKYANQLYVEILIRKALITQNDKEIIN